MRYDRILERIFARVSPKRSIDRAIAKGYLRSEAHPQNPTMRLLTRSPIPFTVANTPKPIP